MGAIYQAITIEKRSYIAYYELIQKSKHPCKFHHNIFHSEGIFKGFIDDFAEIWKVFTRWYDVYCLFLTLLIIHLLFFPRKSNFAVSAIICSVTG